MISDKEYEKLREHVKLLKGLLTKTMAEAEDFDEQRYLDVSRVVTIACMGLTVCLPSLGQGGDRTEIIARREEFMEATSKGIERIETLISDFMYKDDIYSILGGSDTNRKE
jgi:hypothetical protein